MDEFFKQIGLALLEWARLNRLWFSISVAVFCGLLAYVVVPFLPGKSSETAPPASTTIQQQSGDNSSCSNMVASGHGSVNCSATPEDKPHEPSKTEPAKHK